MRSTDETRDACIPTLHSPRKRLRNCSLRTPCRSSKPFATAASRTCARSQLHSTRRPRTADGGPSLVKKHDFPAGEIVVGRDDAELAILNRRGDNGGGVLQEFGLNLRIGPDCGLKLATRLIDRRAYVAI